MRIAYITNRHQPATSSNYACFIPCVININITTKVPNVISDKTSVTAVDVVKIGKHPHINVHHQTTRYSSTTLEFSSKPVHFLELDESSPTNPFFYPIYVHHRDPFPDEPTSAVAKWRNHVIHKIGFFECLVWHHLADCVRDLFGSGYVVVFFCLEKVMSSFSGAVFFILGGQWSLEVWKMAGFSRSRAFVQCLIRRLLWLLFLSEFLLIGAHLVWFHLVAKLKITIC